MVPQDGRSSVEGTELACDEAVMFRRMRFSGVWYRGSTLRRTNLDFISDRTDPFLHATYGCFHLSLVDAVMEIEAELSGQEKPRFINIESGETNGLRLTCVEYYSKSRIF